MAMVPDPNNIRLAMLGMVEENGHPYSWSAIINGEFDAEEMSRCAYAQTAQHLLDDISRNGIGRAVCFSFALPFSFYSVAFVQNPGGGRSTSYRLTPPENATN